ncbi:MAG: hypothetical protein Kow0092_15020 [Deferrisomatales bacterium]
MRGWLRRWAGAALLVAWVAGGAGAREVYGVSGAELGLYLGSNLLAGWRVAEARRVADELLEKDPSDPRAQALDAHVLFFEGRYREALDRLEGGSAGPFRDLVAATVEATRGFHRRESAHFAVFWDDPKDEVLVEPALEALEAAREALAAELGFEPEGRVRVEIYPTVESFTAVSTLTRREVETSGTIGLCKFNRIMLTSPRATLWGYRWRDTLCHEYVHLAVFRLSRGLAPIWIHEGIAKYLEGSWRGVVGELAPSAQALLARRLEEDRLISLEEMSPSVAKLPSAEDTALAFAEVATMVQFLVERRGRDAPERLVAALAAHGDDRAALEAVWGDTFDSFQEGWRRWAKELPLRREDVQVVGLRLAEHARGEGEEEAPGEIRDPRARDYARLGDLLRGRGRPRAAAAEYAKAYAAAPDAPGIAAKHALGLLDREDYDEAVRVCREALRLYPDLPVLWYRLGSAELGRSRWREAVAAFQEMMEINPFHLPAREGLVTAWRALGEAAEAARHERALQLLGGGHREDARP